MKRLSCKVCGVERTLYNEEVEFIPVGSNHLCSNHYVEFQEWEAKQHMENLADAHRSGMHFPGFCPLCPPGVFHD